VVYPLVSVPGEEGFSLAMIILNGLNDQVKHRTAKAEYEIVAGWGRFTVWDGGCPRTREVELGDTVTIPAGTPYRDEGVGLVMIAMNHPAFDSEDVVILD